MTIFLKTYFVYLVNNNNKTMTGRSNSNQYVLYRTYTGQKVSNTDFFFHRMISNQTDNIP